jgi:hypothetical protein
MANTISTDELKQIKEILEKKINETSDSDDNSSDLDSSKKKNKINYKLKYNQSESRYRYLQLEMSNLNIEINELKEKNIILDKYNLLNKNINFLFDRLDNAFKILNDRINNNNISLFSLDHQLELCCKTKDKYDVYINENVYPLFSDDQLILKKLITIYYLDKIKEFDTILTLIKIKKRNIKFHNIFILGSIIICSILLINIILYLYFII